MILVGNKADKTFRLALIQHNFMITVSGLFEKHLPVLGDNVKIKDKN